MYKQSNYTDYSFSESIVFKLSALDQFNNPREAIWEVDAPQEDDVRKDHTSFSGTDKILIYIMHYIFLAFGSNLFRTNSLYI